MTIRREEPEPIPVAKPGAPAGWYAPEGEWFSLRFWDGKGWTDHRAPGVAQPPKLTVLEIAQGVALGSLIFLGAFLVLAALGFFS